MPSQSTTPNVDAVDDLASQFKRYHQRLSSLERASTSGMSQADIIAIGDPRYVNVTGDSMTGTLTFPNTGLPFLQAFGDSSWMGFYSAGGGSRRGYLQGNANGLVLNSESGRLSLNGADGMNMTPFKINGYTASESATANRIVLAGASGYIIGNYINMTADVAGGWPAYVAGQNGDNYLRWYNRSGSFSASRITGNANSNQWSNCAVSSDVGTGWAAHSYHPGGIAVVMAAGNGFGNNVYIRDSAFNASSAQLIAQGFALESSRRWKSNINDWPLRSGGAAVERASDVTMRLRPVTFHRADYDDQQIPSGRRLAALRRLIAYNDNRGLPPYQLPPHDCDTDDCNGSADDPCVRVINQRRSRFGLIAEEVAEVVPEAVHLDNERQPDGIEYSMLTTVLIATVQELTGRISTLEDHEHFTLKGVA